VLKNIKDEELFGDIPLKHGDVIRGNAKPDEHYPTICDTYCDEVKKWVGSTNFAFSDKVEVRGLDQLELYERFEGSVQNKIEGFLKKKKYDLHHRLEDSIAVHLAAYDGYIGKFPPARVQFDGVKSVWLDNKEVDFHFFSFPIFGAGYAGRIESAYNRLFPYTESEWPRSSRICVGFIISLLLLLGHSGLLPWFPCIPLLLPAGKPQLIAWGVEMLILMVSGGSFIRVIDDESDSVGRFFKALPIAIGVLLLGVIFLRPGQDGGISPFVVYCMMGFYALGLLGVLFDLMRNGKKHWKYRKEKRALQKEFLHVMDCNAADLERYLRFIELWAESENRGKVPKNHGQLCADLKKYRKIYKKLK